jgi:transcriptional/translational regulatory protein YebC/TACO1
MLNNNGFNPVNTEVLMRPDNYVTLDQSSSETMIRLVDNLEDLDDVQNVYTNADIPDEYLSS